jgi:hypothetical protein
MRVTRRIRPSHVGCGATIGRRRLYAASQTRGATVAETPQLPRVAFVIQPDGRMHALALADEQGRDHASEAELIALSASGR